MKLILVGHKRQVIDLGDAQCIELHVVGESKEPKPQGGTEARLKLELQASAVYDLYPRKVGRPKALKSIERAIRKFGYAHIHDRATVFAAVWQDAPKERLQFCPHPSTFYNQERFQDEESEWQRATRDGRLGEKQSRNTALDASAKDASKRLAQTHLADESD